MGSTSNFHIIGKKKKLGVSVTFWWILTFAMLQNSVVSFCHMSNVASLPSVLELGAVYAAAVGRLLMVISLQIDGNSESNYCVTMLNHTIIFLSHLVIAFTGAWFVIT